MDYIDTPSFPPYVEGLMKKYRVPGLSVAVVQGERSFSAGYGLATMDPPKPCTADTLFDIASCSKIVTAASVALLVRDPEKYPDVKYDSVMSKLLPGDFILQGQEYTDSVTLDDILGHRSGIPRHDDSYLGERAAKPDNAKSVTRNLRNLMPAAPVRSKYMYSNIMYTVASYLVAQKSGRPFHVFVEENFFHPLGMSSTHVHPCRSRSFGLGDRIATGYSWSKKTESYSSFPAYDCHEGEGAGSIVTSVNDYIKWVKALMNKKGPIDSHVYGGLVKKRTIVSPGDDNDREDEKLMISPLIYAAGLEIFNYRGHQVIGHDGSICGFGSKFFFVPSLKLGGAIFGNSSEAADVATILTHEMIDDVLGLPAGGRPDWDRRQWEIFHVYHVRADQAELRNKLNQNREPQKMPLDAYTGEYWNPGYKCMKVDIKNGKLVIDATDRSYGYTLEFEHLRGQTEYAAKLMPILEDSEDLVAARFEFRNNKAIRLALRLEIDLEEPIWFERVQEA